MSMQRYCICIVARGESPVKHDAGLLHEVCSAVKILFWEGYPETLQIVKFTKIQNLPASL